MRSTTERKASHTRRRNPYLYKCELCRTFHPIRFCKKFLDMDALQRRIAIRTHNYCENCLAKSHTTNACPSTDSCRKCKARHHTLLHGQYPRNQNTTSSRSHSKRPHQQQSTVKQASQQKASIKSRARKHTKKAKETRETPTTPNHLILSEAIRSLAAVLCSSPSFAQVQGRRHV
ncbi:uncharacterized protein LOC142230053 [Haematobia irritans]|uniref:uncharacterized protein LOC142222137 n=1 Tax=Haematobia irritans TaxID=7368 RepID=UPI003F4FB17C